MEFSIKKSFKPPHGSNYKHMRKISVGGRSSNASSHEQLPILQDQELSDGHRGVKVKMDGAADSIPNYVKDNDSFGSVAHLARKSSYEFWPEVEDQESSNMKSLKNETVHDYMQRGEDPSRLIGQFLNKQKTNGEIALDMDMEMEELKQHQDSSQLNIDHSREIRVSFGPNPVEAAKESMRRRYKDSPEGGGGETNSNSHSMHAHKGQSNSQDIRNREEILRCTPSASFNRNISFQKKPSLLMKIKTRSRFQDPPQEEMIELRSGKIAKSGQMKSGIIGKGGGDDDDDPLWTEDLPEEYTRSHLGLLTLLQWASLILIIAALICSLSITFLKEKRVWELELWKWEVMVLVLICGRLFSGWGIHLIVYFIERNFLLRKRLLYFVYGVRKPVQNCLWLGLVLIAWGLLFNRRVERETRSQFLKYITKILICMLIGTFLWLVKTLMVKVLASSFHVSTYFDRIQESLFNQYVIEILSGPPLVEMQRTEDEMEMTLAEVHDLQNAGAVLPPDLKDAAFQGGGRSGRVIGRSSRHSKSGKQLSGVISKKDDPDSGGITIDHLHKLNHKNVSAWNMKRLMKIVRHGSLSTLDEQVLGSTANEDDSAKEIRSVYEAKAAARKIFLNVSRPGSKHIYLEDLLRFMKDDEALKTMSLFEGAAETRRISKASLKNWVVNSFRERKALALTLNDTKTAVNRLHRIVNVLVGIIILITWLIILEIATSRFLLFVSSQLVLVAFVFGNTCKTIFESLIFLFIIHPFDVGDRCEVDGVQMVVEEMNILTTVFLRYDNLKIIYPNTNLSQMPISNFYRSPDMGDAVEFCIHVTTPAEKIALIRQRIMSYVDGKKEHWYESPMIIFKDSEELNRVRIAVWLSHKMNHQNMGERWARRSLLVEEMVQMFKELDIQYRLLPLDINVKAVPAITSERMPSTWTSAASSPQI